MTPRATVDFETKSECSLKACGTHRYAEDPTTTVLCLAYRLPHWTPGRVDIWHPAYPALDREEYADPGYAEFIDWIVDGKRLEAHNAQFERVIWSQTLARAGWPEVALRQWMCSAAKAAACAFPRGLDDAAAALRLRQRKSEDGHKVMMKMTKPRNPLKAERVAWARQHAPCHHCATKGKIKVGRAKAEPCLACGGLGYLTTGHIPDMPTLWHETTDLLDSLLAYCRQDVLTEEAVSHALPDLSDEEQELYWLDQEINTRGFRIDRDAVECALGWIDEESQGAYQELLALTGGQVEKPTQRTRMLNWLESEGLTLDNTQADTIDAALEPGSYHARFLTPTTRRALELMRELGRSSTAKYTKMQDHMCGDDRVRGGLLYHGASTGRWSGAGVQPHNFPKPTVKGFEMGAAWTALQSGDRGQVEAIGPVMEVLSNALRGAIVPAAGSALYVGDFAGIEARVLLWAAGDEDGLDIFREGRDIYCEMAGEIYHRPITKKDEAERALGKVAILGLGYQMGAAKFVETALTYGIVLTEELFCQRKGCGEAQTRHWRVRSHEFEHPTPDLMTSAKVVHAYRTRFSLVKDLWAEQEATAIWAVQHPGRSKDCGVVSWWRDKSLLWCVLPNGRMLSYPYPEIHQKRMSWTDKNGDDVYKDSLTFMGVDTYTKQWRRQTTYGGSIVENIVQAIARDLMAEAMIRTEATGLYRLVLTVHDEEVAEGPAGRDLAEFTDLMSGVPLWASGCPIKVEAWSGNRYRK